MKRRTRALLCLLTGLVVVLGPASAARADQWQDRVWAGSGYATGAGTTVAIALFDRGTGLYRDNGVAAHTRIESASVMKLFIAENLLHRRDLGQIRLTAADLTDMSRMLRESYDAAANRFWSSYGTNAIVSDVIGRYGLSETGLTSNVRYWGNTLITAHDIVVFYQRLMDGSGGLSAGSRNWIVDQLRQSTEQGDGGRQFFGLHDGLPLEHVIAQKQGWMCCVNGSAYRHSTGLVGPDGRYAVAVLTREPSDRGTAHLEASITGAVRTMFPEGLIPRVQGDIGELWYRMGGTRSLLGYPTSDELGLPGGAVSRFQGGFIYWTPSTGPHWVAGDILRKYGAYGYERSVLRYPVSDEVPLAGGALSRFQGGSIYWSPGTGAHAVGGDILARYGTYNWEKGVLGYPTSDELALVGGALNRFQGGFVYWSPATGAHAVGGAILGAYGATGWERGWLGYPTSEETRLPGGAVSRFSGGAVYWSPQGGAHPVRGPILTAYETLGAGQGDLGYPTRDELTLVNGGAVSVFQKGALYWTRATGAHWLGGDLLTAYGAQGYERGPLGYPTSDPHPVAGGTRVDFQRGSLTLTPSGQVLRDEDAAPTAVTPQPTRTPAPAAVPTPTPTPPPTRTTTTPTPTPTTTPTTAAPTTTPTGDASGATP